MGLTRHGGSVKEEKEEKNCLLISNLQLLYQHQLHVYKKHCLSSMFQLALVN